MSDSAPVVDALRAAYIQANPDVPEQDIEIYTKYIDTEVMDTDG